MVAIIKYRKIKNDHAIYIKVFYGGTVSFLPIFTDDVLNVNNNETAFTEIRRVLKKLLILHPKRDISLSTLISEFDSPPLVLLLIILITS